MIKIGCHVSIAGGIEKAPERAAELGCEVFQMFTRSPRGGTASQITREIAKSFKFEMQKRGQGNCYIHTPYYINFASQNKSIREASARVIREELERGSLIGARFVMTHLGSSGEFVIEKAMDLTAAGLIKALKSYKGTTKLLLEISAGAGNIIGDTFDELKYILNKIGDMDVGVCLDSAHMYASGYDIKTGRGFKETLKIIKNTVGLDRIKLIHANDSKVDLGGKKDRHDHIGAGKIGEEGFINLIHTFSNIDFLVKKNAPAILSTSCKLLISEFERWYKLSSLKK